MMRIKEVCDMSKAHTYTIGELAKGYLADACFVDHYDNVSMLVLGNDRAMLRHYRNAQYLPPARISMYLP